MAPLQNLVYCKTHKNSDTQKIYCNYPKTGLSYRVIGPKDADRMANRVDPDQTARLAVC